MGLRHVSGIDPLKGGESDPTQSVGSLEGGCFVTGDEGISSRITLLRAYFSMLPG